MQTPNFAMDTDDIEPGAAGQRFTSHVFDPEYREILKPTRVPDDMFDWPPAVLFDAVYACAVMNNFGVLAPDTLTGWKGTFYPGGPTTAAHAAEQHRHDAVVAARKKSDLQRDERTKRFARRTKQREGGTADAMDIVMFLPHMLMQREEVERYWKERREATAAKEREELEAAVSSWRQDVPADS